MVVKVGVFGSCVTRDVFTTIFNKNYKNYFEVVASAQRSSFISLMSKPCNIDNNLLELNSQYVGEEVNTSFLKDDLEKNFLQDLIKNKPDYLVIDNFFDARMGVLFFNDTIVTNNNWEIPKTKLCNEITNCKTLKIEEEPDKYLNLFYESFDLFFKFIRKNLPDLKIVLNKARAINKMENQGKVEYINYHLNMSEFNYYWNLLDEYIEENFDVDVVNFDNTNVFIDKNHVWKPGPVHYTKNYYTDFLYVFKNIVDNDLIGMMDSNNDNLKKNRILKH